MMLKIKFLQLLFSPNQTKIQPEDYLKASGEVYFLIMFSSLVSTYFFDYANIINNPTYICFGYYNVFFGFLSFEPAKYFVAFIGSFFVYIIIQYNKYDILRTRLIGRRIGSFKSYISILSNLFYLFSSTCLLLILFFNPQDSYWVILFIFMQFVIFNNISAFANFLEYNKPSLIYKIFISLKTLVSTVLIILILDEYFNDEITFHNTNNYFIMTFDYLWILLFFIEKFSIFESEKIEVLYQT